MGKMVEMNLPCNLMNSGFGLMDKAGSNAVFRDLVSMVINDCSRSRSLTDDSSLSDCLRDIIFFSPEFENLDGGHLIYLIDNEEVNGLFHDFYNDIKKYCEFDYKILSVEEFASDVRYYQQKMLHSAIQNYAKMNFSNFVNYAKRTH